MEKTFESTGKTVDEAVENGLLAMSLKRDDVTVEVLERPKSGFLGLGSVPARVRLTYSVSRPQKAELFMRGLLEHMQLTAEVVVTEKEGGHIDIELKGADMGLLIGRHGETLDALQFITSQVVNKDEETRVRVVVDAQDYRKKREATLISLATRTAEKVVKYRRNFTLEPMNSYERHVIHTALQDYKGVSTASVGSEPHRSVVIVSLEGGRPATDSERRDDRKGGFPGGRGGRKPGMARPYPKNNGGKPKKDN